MGQYLRVLRWYLSKNFELWEFASFLSKSLKRQTSLEVSRTFLRNDFRETLKKNLNDKIPSLSEIPNIFHTCAQILLKNVRKSWIVCQWRAFTIIKYNVQFKLLVSCCIQAIYPEKKYRRNAFYISSNCVEHWKHSNSANQQPPESYYYLMERKENPLCLSTLSNRP